MDSDVNKCNKDGELFDCICGDEYYKSIDDFQQNINSKVLEYDSRKLSQVILHQNTNDQRLCSRLVKLYDIVAGFQDGSEDTSIFVQRLIQAIVICQEKNKKHSEFFVSVLSSAFTNYCQYYQDLLNEEYFEVMKKKPMSIPLTQMTSLGCDAFIKVKLRSFKKYPARL